MMKLSEIAKLLDAELSGKDTNILGVSIDSRTTSEGDLFIALQGENFNGHDFIEKAKQKGAVAAAISQPTASDISTIQVHDTLNALGTIAAFHREQIQIPIIGVTGSCGKTTTKTMIFSILQQCGPALATEGTLNNHIGVPLTLLRLEEQHKHAVIEMGANHPEEISYVTRLVQPAVAVITNVAPAHLEGFGSLDVVAKSKGEIFEGLGPNGIAVINADDSYADYWRKMTAELKLISFGIEKPADVHASNIVVNAKGNPSFTLSIRGQGDVEIILPLLGEYNIKNALAAAAACHALGVSLAAIKAGLETVAAVNGRMVKYEGHDGACVIDDSYNANPTAAKLALTVLAKDGGDTIFVLGDMGELGENTEQLHLEVGQYAKLLGIGQLFACGQLSRFAVRGFGENGHHFNDKIALIEALKHELRAGVTVLVKGSRAAEMEQVVVALVQD